MAPPRSILRAGDGGATEIENAGEHLWPDTLGIMGWSVDPEGFGVIFRRTIPDFVRAHLNPAVVRILADMQLTMADIGRFVCHPGGAKVVNALETALALDQGTLDCERQVIADYGNMSSPTILFVLEQVMAKGLPARSLLTALGPASPQAASRCGTPRDLGRIHSRLDHAAARRGTRHLQTQHRKAAGARRRRGSAAALSP